MSKTFLIVDGDFFLDEGGRAILVGQDPTAPDEVELPPGVKAEPGKEGETSALIKLSQDLAEVLASGYVPEEGYGNKAISSLFQVGRSRNGARTLVGQQVQDAVVRLMEFQQADLGRMTPGELINRIEQLLVIPGDVPTDVTFYVSVVSDSGENVKRAYLTKMGHQLGFDL